MDIIYKYSESDVKPLSFEKGKRTVFLRKNIQSVERVNAFGNTFTIWTYQEAKMSHEEFKEYSDFIAAQNAINGVNDSSNISQIIDGQENGDNNQLIIMEAIADLYDLIATMI